MCTRQDVCQPLHEAYSWKSCLGKGTTLYFNFMVFFLYKASACTLDGWNTFTVFFKYLYWSFFWLSEGVWPERDVNDEPYDPDSLEGKRAGHPLCPGPNGEIMWRGQLWVLACDLEHAQNRYGQAGPTDAQPCTCCRANITDVPWTACSPGQCDWEATVWTKEAWEAAHPLEDRHLLMQLPGVTMLNYYPDHMHCKHLGTDPVLYGSGLKYMVYHMLPGTPEANLDLVWAGIKAEYKAP